MCNRSYAARVQGAKAENGDRVTISFKGTIDSVPFDGGTGENIQVTIGSNSFIPGFEEQLIGIAQGETRTLKVSFPKNYAQRRNSPASRPSSRPPRPLVEAPQETEDRRRVRQGARAGIARQAEGSRARAADGGISPARPASASSACCSTVSTRPTSFEAPPSLVEEEFNLMWNSIKAEMELSRQDLRRRRHHGRGGRRKSTTRSPTEG